MLRMGPVGSRNIHMHYIIHCLDKPESSEIRAANLEAHKAYVAAAPVRVIISGPLVAEDNSTAIGSCFLVEAASLQDAEALNRDDPLNRAGLWAQISIHPFLKRVDNRG